MLHSVSAWWGHLLRAWRSNTVEPQALDEPLDVQGPPWPHFDGPLSFLPRGRSGMLSAYGDPQVSYTSSGEAKVSRKWERANMVIVPASLIPGYDKRLYMHRLVEPYFREAMRRASIVCPEYRPQRIGCFAPRHQRHDRKRPLSDHTWGIAFDVDPHLNRSFYQMPDAPKVEPFGVGWESLSSLPEPFVSAFESVGFEWGGRWSTFVDPMHFSLRTTEVKRVSRGTIPIGSRV